MHLHCVHDTNFSATCTLPACTTPLGIMFVRALTLIVQNLCGLRATDLDVFVFVQAALPRSAMMVCYQVQYTGSLALTPTTCRSSKQMCIVHVLHSHCGTKPFCTGSKPATYCAV